MESDGCLSTLPAVLAVLSDPKQSPPDDTSLEKLIDWFQELVNQNNAHILTSQQFLLEFILSVCSSNTTEPSIMAFTLKLTGLLAATEQSFLSLEEQSVLRCTFMVQGWNVCGLWEDASVRSGWLHGLLYMLKHQQAFNFICVNGLMQKILDLQKDLSLFVASLANDALVTILSLAVSSEMTDRHDAVVSSDSSSRPGCVSITSEITRAIAELLVSEESSHVQQGLQSLSLVLSRCDEPVRSKVWVDVLEPLEDLIDIGSESLTPALISTLHAAVRTPLLHQSGCKAEEMLIALCDENRKNHYQCAAIVIKLDKCPEVLKSKAVNTILVPLRCVLTECHAVKRQDATAEKLKEQLSQKSTCISLFVRSFTSVAELANTKYPFEDIHSVTDSVMSLLKICSGHSPSPFLPSNISIHLIGCCKIQRCGLDALRALSVYEENLDLIKEAFDVFYDYLQNPDSHATVLKKAFLATMKWIEVFLHSEIVLQTFNQNFVPVLRKRLYDLRWEVRDSTLEFIAQLAAALRGNSGFTEAFHDSGLVSAVVSSLADTEGYVRASAVAAVRETLVCSSSCDNLLEEAVALMMTILSHDSESFPRRAVVQTFTSWLKESHAVMTGSLLKSVLTTGSNDFDWEVKMHTLELAEALMDKSLYEAHSFNSSENSSLTRALSEWKDLGLFDALFNSLFDCDRPVSEKACAILLKFRSTTVAHIDQNTLVLSVSGCRWGDGVHSRYHHQNAWRESVTGDVSLLVLLQMLDLDDMQKTLTLSCDHVVNSTLSLMEDIVSAAQQTDENLVDCY